MLLSSLDKSLFAAFLQLIFIRALLDESVSEALIAEFGSSLNFCFGEIELSKHQQYTSDTALSCLVAIRDSFKSDFLVNSSFSRITFVCNLSTFLILRIPSLNYRPLFSL